MNIHNEPPVSAKNTELTICLVYRQSVITVTAEEVHPSRTLQMVVLACLKIQPVVWLWCEDILSKRWPAMVCEQKYSHMRKGEVLVLSIGAIMNCIMKNSDRKMHRLYYFLIYWSTVKCVKSPKKVHASHTRKSEAHTNVHLHTRTHILSFSHTRTVRVFDHVV